MRHEIKKSAECLLYNNDNQMHLMPSLSPLHYGFRSHGRNGMEKMPILLKDRPEFDRHCQRYANVRHIGKDCAQVLLPRFCGSLSAARTESRLAGVENHLRLGF